MTDVNPWDDQDPMDYTEPQGAKIEDPADVKTFVLAGNAHFTLVSLKTGDRFTFRVEETPASEDGKPKAVTHFVGLLTEPDNSRGYKYIGHVFRDGAYTHGKKSKIAWDAPGAQAFHWFWQRVILQGSKPEDLKLEFWHEGQCGRCGRRLTVPESIARGIGPECAKMVGGE